MPVYQPIPQDDRVPLNRNEMFALELVYALQAKVQEMDALEKRMRQIGVWQYYKPALGMLTKVLRALLDNLCDRNARHMEEVRTKYLVHLRPKPVVGSLPTEHIVSSAELQALCNCAIRDKCCMCMKDIRSAKKCVLRGLFLQIAPPDECRIEGMCEYATMEVPEPDKMDE